MRRNIVRHLVMSFASVLFLILAIAGCSEKSSITSPVQTTASSSLDKHGFEPKFKQVNLVSDLSMQGVRTDPVLLNAWGIAVTPTGFFWLSANGSGMTVIYDAEGNQKLAPKTIPFASGETAGNPSGVVFNSTNVFMLPDGSASRFIFVSEDGIVSAWGLSSGSSAVTVADQSAQDAVYKGVEIAQNNGNSFLYATNFKQAKIDVFDSNFNLVSGMSFTDPNLPAGYAPFGIKNINGMLYVTYAKQKLPEKMDDDKGPGHGFIDIYTPGGVLVSRFASMGSLNSPWGIAEGVTRKLDDKILIGNFGDGRINVFSRSGEFLGQLRGKMDKPITIDGLWGLFTSKSIPGIENRIYFTAGPNDESDGLFGYLLGKKSNDGDKDRDDEFADHN